MNTTEHRDFSEQIRKRAEPIDKLLYGNLALICKVLDHFKIEYQTEGVGKNLIGTKCGLCGGYALIRYAEAQKGFAFWSCMNQAKEPPCDAGKPTNIVQFVRTHVKDKKMFAVFAEIERLLGIKSDDRTPPPTVAPGNKPSFIYPILADLERIKKDFLLMAEYKDNWEKEARKLRAEIAELRGTKAITPIAKLQAVDQQKQKDGAGIDGENWEPPI